MIFRVNYRVGDKRNGFEEKEFTVESIRIDIAASRAASMIWHIEPSNKHKDFYRIEEICDAKMENK